MIIPEVADLFEKALKEVNKPISAMVVMELGNIIIKHCLNEKRISSKNWFIKQHCPSHISIDINDKDGALPLDLGTPLPQFNNTADFINNGGTAEHVNLIYQCFMNIHNWCKVGGIMINWGPPTNTALHHSPWSYDLHFPQYLCDCNGYDLIEQDIRVPITGRNPNPKDNLLIIWIARKMEDCPFMEQDEWIEMNGVTRR